MAAQAAIHASRDEPRVRLREMTLKRKFSGSHFLQQSF
jgi:phage baseplate assembly protein W